MLKITDAEFDRLVTKMHKEFGIDLRKKRVLIEGRLNSLLSERGFDSYTKFLDMVFADRTGQEITGLINRLTTNHTYFMREPQHYDYLKNELLPYFERENSSKQINIWSAGCSSGEEPYTTAMLLAEHFGARKSLWNTKIQATDISQRVLAKAKEGIYSKDGMKDLPPDWIRKYFVPVDETRYKVSPKIQAEVNFGIFNLMGPISPLKKFDLIFCRNVMIYFDMPTKTALVNRFFEVTKPGGYLFIGHAESIQRDVTGYEYIKPAIYRKPL